MRSIIGLTAACVLTLAASASHGQEQTNSDKFVSKEEYLKLKADHEQLKQELEAIKALLRQPPPGATATNVPPPGGDNLKARVEQLEKKQEQQQSENDQSLDQLDK